jgi:hypothetical protein
MLNETPIQYIVRQRIYLPAVAATPAYVGDALLLAFSFIPVFLDICGVVLAVTQYAVCAPAVPRYLMFSGDVS